VEYKRLKEREDKEAKRGWAGIILVLQKNLRGGKPSKTMVKRVFKNEGPEEQRNVGH